MKSIAGGEPKELEISEQQLRECLRECMPGYLKGTARIMGVLFHVEAYEIHRYQEFNQTINPEFNDRLEAVEDAYKTGFEQIELDRKSYILVITPEGR